MVLVKCTNQAILIQWEVVSSHSLNKVVPVVVSIQLLLKGGVLLNIEDMIEKTIGGITQEKEGGHRDQTLAAEEKRATIVVITVEEDVQEALVHIVAAVEVVAMIDVGEEETTAEIGEEVVMMTIVEGGIQVDDRTVQEKRRRVY